MFKVGDRVRIKTEKELLASGLGYSKAGEYVSSDETRGILPVTLLGLSGSVVEIDGSKNAFIRIDDTLEPIFVYAHQLTLIDTPKLSEPSNDLSKVAVKFDSSKIPLELLPPEALVEIAKVLAFGAKKYSAWNWAKGFAWSRLAGAALRHLFAWLGGEDKDPESGLSHLSHCACCLLFLISHELRGLGDDDRFKYER